MPCGLSLVATNNVCSVWAEMGKASSCPMWSAVVSTGSKKPEDNGRRLRTMEVCITLLYMLHVHHLYTCGICIIGSHVCI